MTEKQKKIEIKKTRDKIVEAMQISALKLIEKKKLLGQKMVISENGIIKTINPSDL